MLDGCRFRFDLSIQNIGCHFAGLEAQFVVVYGKGSQGSVFCHDIGPYDDRNLVGVRNLHEGRNGGSQGVIGGNVDEIDFSHQRFRYLLDIIDVIDCPFFHGEFVLFAVFLHHVGLNFGIDFGRAVDEADSLRIRNEGPAQIHLGIDGGQIGYAGHIAAGMFIVFDQFGGGIVGNGCSDDGNILDFIGCCLSCRSGDGADQFWFFRFEPGDDGLQVRLVALSILLVEIDFVFIIASLFQAFHKALVCLIQGTVLHDLDNGDNRLIRGGKLLFPALSAISAASIEKGCRSQSCCHTEFHPLFHLFLPLPISCIYFPVLPWCRLFPFQQGRN